MNQRFFLPIILLLLSVAMLELPAFAAAKKKYVVIGYAGGYNGLVDANQIDAKKLTHINYAFVDIKDNKAWLHNENTDTTNFRNLNRLKQINPDLKILISIGGWSWSENFSDAVLTDASRKAFAQSAVEIVKKYDLDGIDIDWEYPAMPGEEDNIYRPEDRQNYTLMFAALRNEMNLLQRENGKKYFLTTAVGASFNFITHTQMDQAEPYLDYINIMTYDYKTEVDTIAGHHTNLYLSADTADEHSANRSVQWYLGIGLPANKLVMGIAFYGRGWIMQNDDHQGLYRKAVSPSEVGGFTFLKDSIINRNGYLRYWDEDAKAAYCYNSNNKIFISYDDEESVKYKCKYVKKHKLAGVMFWEYFADPKGYLLNTIEQNLR